MVHRVSISLAIGGTLISIVAYIKPGTRLALVVQ